MFVQSSVVLRDTMMGVYIQITCLSPKQAKNGNKSLIMRWYYYVYMMSCMMYSGV